MIAGQTWTNQRERRFRLSRDQALVVLVELGRRLPAITYGSADPRSVVVTTYLDTPDRRYLGIADASNGHRSLKLRIREYLALDGGGGYRHQPHCWLERKERVGELRTKQRVRLDKGAIGDLLERRLRLAGSGSEALALEAELAGHLFVPIMVCCYERRVFGEDHGLRLTYDERIAFYEPPAGLYRDHAVLGPASLGLPLASGPSRMIELKQPAATATPSWLEEILAGLEPADGYSKFRDGVHALDASNGPVDITRPLIALEL